MLFEIKLHGIISIQARRGIESSDKVYATYDSE